MKEKIGKIFKRGLIALAPLAITLVIVFWLLGALEHVFRPPLEWMLGKYYVTGMGVVVALVVILFVGGIINILLVQKFSLWLERLLIRIPFFRTFYNSVGDLMSYFSPKEAEERGKMVVVEINEMRFLGMLTRETYEGMPPGLGDDDHVTVFVPYSYMIGGLTITVPRANIKPIDISVEQGMRFNVTAGMKAKDKK